MNLKKVFEILVTEFEKEKIEFALIGGLALQFAGVSRATVDIDFTVLLEQSDTIFKIMSKYGYKAIHRTQDVANFFSQFAELGRVDYLFAHRKYALKMLKRAGYKEIFGLKVKVIMPEDLIGLKVQSSFNDKQRYNQDMADIEAIISKNFNNLDMKLVREYFKLFDRENELDKIFGTLK
ncbi:MAG: hypothetical protein BWY26_00023 [Elusimicrobia bacterium ADurb.Bin231]|nr:MAG: hypothetical protein BWY26_00023 [Elusimicrobia bacterium ADurb.Bin231]